MHPGKQHITGEKDRPAMLTISNLTKTFRGADEPIFSGVSFTVNAGERVGLIGPNGAGKTTLLRCILGETAPDAGSVQFNPPTLRIGYLPQGLDVPDDRLVRDLLTPGAADLRAAEAELERLAVALSSAEGEALDRLSEEYTAALERVEALSAQTDSTNARSEERR